MFGVELSVWVLFAIALANAYTAFVALQTRAMAAETNVNVALVEKATNSMKDALVEATKASAHAAGREEMRSEAAITAAVLAEGVVIGEKKEK